MRKFHQNIILFGLLLALVLVMVEVLLTRNTKTHIDLKFEEIYNPTEKADVLILGNSHAAHGINPKYLQLENHASYNFALNGCTPKYYKKWYNKVLRDQYPKPKYIIYAVDWAMFDNAPSERTFDIDIRLMPFTVFLDEFFNDPEIDKKALIRNNFNILFKPRQLQYLFYKQRKQDFIDLSSYFNGYVPHVTNKVKMGKSPKELTTNKEWQTDFAELLDQLQNDSIQVIFVNIPEYIPSWDSPGIVKRLNYLDSIAVKNNIPYLKYNQELVSEINNDSTYFNNWIHLNDKGAAKFSEMLSCDLQKIIK